MKWSLLFAALTAVACGSSTSTSMDTDAVVAQYAAIAKQGYTDAAAGAAALQVKVDAFVAAPTAATLTAARDAWVQARVPYRQTEALRFYGGPIDAEDDDRELRINSWPLDESYIDGLINSNVELTEALLIDANFKNGETNISTGYHALEYLLWGKDTSTTGPGDRPFTDYTTAAGAARRGQFLKVAAALLSKDLQHVATEWNESYATELSMVPAIEALRRMLTGMGALAAAELSGERMLTAYENQDQEDEHSCFSDTTLDDLLGNARGIENVYLGRYGTLSGKGIYDLVAAKDKVLADRLKNEIATAIADIEQIPAPFDQAILGADTAAGRIKVLAAIRAVQKVGATIVEASTSLGVTIQPNP